MRALHIFLLACAAQAYAYAHISAAKVQQKNDIHKFFCFFISFIAFDHVAYCVFLLCLLRLITLFIVFFTLFIASKLNLDTAPPSSSSISGRCYRPPLPRLSPPFSSLPRAGEELCSIGLPVAVRRTTRGGVSCYHLLVIHR